MACEANEARERRVGMKEPRKKLFSFWTCDFARTSPPLEKLSADTRTLNVEISFVDALKLNLAIDECVRRINSYKRSTKEGKQAAVGIAIHLKQERIAVYPASLPKPGRGEAVAVLDGAKVE